MTRRWVAVALLLLLTAACSGDTDEAGASGSSSAPVAPGDGSPSSPGQAAVTPSVEQPVEDPACEGGSGVTVERLSDVVIPAVHVPEVVDAESGEVLAPAIDIPAQTAEAGCVLRHAAPGGCIGAVDVSAAEIPSVTIPGTTVQGHEYPPVTIPGVVQPGVHTDEVCQVEDEGGLPTVTREGVVRQGFSRAGGARSGDDLVATVRIEPVRLPDVDIEPVRLERKELRGGDGVGVLDGDTGTSYVAPAQVLFASDQSTLQPGAIPALRAIARQLRADAPGSRLLVDGHTDDRGSAEYGLELSRRRAETVARWLVEAASFDAALITTRGYGETRPAYPNDTPARQQLNRRVVITTVR